MMLLVFLLGLSERAGPNNGDESGGHDPREFHFQVPFLRG
jgi:hypothetical protein